jgi:cytoskeletal protein RodZ
MNTIGETLRRERVRQGYDLQKLSESTKIGTRMLHAMETGDLSKLPGGVFTRSFYKQYAAILGLDSDFVESELRQLLPEAAPALPQPEQFFSNFNPPRQKSNSLTAAAVWVLLAFGGCGAVYYFAKNYQTIAPKPAEALASRISPPPPISPPAKATEVSSAPQAPAGPSIGSGSLQVVLNASEESWVSVTVDGKLLFSGILKPNDRREIKAEERVKVIAGNAGGLDISLNGKDLETLGPRGQVRTIELTRAGAQVVSRTPKPAPLL